MSDESSLTSPEGVLMLCVAVVFDIISIIPVVNDFSTIPAMIIIGLWMILRGSGTQSVKEKAGEKIKDKTKQAVENVAKTEVKTAVKRGGLRFLGVTLAEFIPVVSAIPFWTWFVFKELGGMGGGSGKKEESEEGEDGQEKPTPNLPQRDASSTEKNNSIAA